jgi:hypothetical protein
MVGAEAQADASIRKKFGAVRAKFFAAVLVTAIDA